jgi:hypothetical protein
MTRCITDSYRLNLPSRSSIPGRGSCRCACGEPFSRRRNSEMRERVTTRSHDLNEPRVGSQ